MVQAYTVQRKSAENASKSTSICFKLSKVQTVYIFTSISDKCASVWFRNCFHCRSKLHNGQYFTDRISFSAALLKVSQEVVQF